MIFRQSIIAMLGLLGLMSLPFAQTQAASQESVTITLLVKKMTCPVCPITIRKALEKLPGVTDVTTDLKTRTATITFNPEQVKTTDLIHATSEVGYPSELDNKNSSEGE